MLGKHSDAVMKLDTELVERLRGGNKEFPLVPGTGNVKSKDGTVFGCHAKKTPPEGFSWAEEGKRMGEEPIIGEGGGKGGRLPVFMGWGGAPPVWGGRM